jgi:hypothetical protein
MLALGMWGGMLIWGINGESIALYVKQVNFRAGFTRITCDAR